ncbi:hypothetical protein NDN08_005291 [Rhodosorus marinus]|uniref:Nuclear pore complex protein n=1 Tax=Rhodosorus marinus TaxID=101924 RepID=A0AAV8V186_9RHOD|nr:hypothetical protein NDN08_005291 [Rhodosorus marinus]
MLFNQTKKWLVEELSADAQLDVSVEAVNARRDLKYSLGELEDDGKSVNVEAYGLLNQGRGAQELALLSEVDPFGVLRALLNRYESQGSVNALLELGNLILYGDCTREFLKNALRNELPEGKRDALQLFAELLVRDQKPLANSSMPRRVFSLSEVMEILLDVERISVIWLNTLSSAFLAQPDNLLVEKHLVTDVCDRLTTVVDRREEQGRLLIAAAIEVLQSMQKRMGFESRSLVFSLLGPTSRIYLCSTGDNRLSTYSRAGRSSELVYLMEMLWAFAAGRGCKWLKDDWPTGGAFQSSGERSFRGRTKFQLRSWMVALALFLTRCTAEEHARVSVEVLQHTFQSENSAIAVQLRVFCALLERPDLSGVVSPDVARVARYICSDISNLVAKLEKRLDGDQTGGSADLPQVPAEVLRSLYIFPLKSLSEIGKQLERGKATCMDLFITVILRLSSLIGSMRAREILEKAFDEGSIPRDLYLSLSQLVK